MHAFDRQTDGRTGRIVIARPRLHFMRRGKNRCRTALLLAIPVAPGRLQSELGRVTCASITHNNRRLLTVYLLFTESWLSNTSLLISSIFVDVLLFDWLPVETAVRVALILVFVWCKLIRTEWSSLLAWLILTTACGNFTKFTTLVHLETKLKWLDHFAVKGQGHS